MDYYFAVLGKYVDFSGRARRAEYWMFQLVNFVVSVALAVVDMVALDSTTAGVGILGTLYGLAVLLPSLAVTARRLHDTNRSGWWILIGAIPILGAIVLLIFLIQDSDPGVNKYGPNPKGEEAAVA